MKYFAAVEKPRVCMICAGAEGTGKTSFAMTAPAPIYVMGTEGGHEQDAILRAKGDKEVYYTCIAPPKGYSPTQVWFGEYKGMWGEFEARVKEVVTLAPGTVVIDSASDLLGMATSGLDSMLKRGEKPMPPLMYGQLYALIKDSINELRSVHNVLMLARLKAEYRDDQPTGEMTLDLWNKGVYLAEHIIFLEKDSKTGRRFGIGTKGAVDGVTLADPTWDKVVSNSRFFGDDDYNLYLLYRRLGQAFAFLDAQGIEYDRRAPSTVEDGKEYLSYLRGLIKPKPEQAIQPVTNGHPVAQN